jgi:hypothetical protein
MVVKYWLRGDLGRPSLVLAPWADGGARHELCELHFENSGQDTPIACHPSGPRPVHLAAR